MKTQIRLEELATPHPKDWEKPYYMLSKKNPGGYDLISLHGFFPVFATREDAAIAVDALKENPPEMAVEVKEVEYAMAAAAELEFGKPAKLVKPRIVSED